MNTAAHQAASDAARARRNAKVAGDVVRRYCINGGNRGNGKSSSGIKNRMKTREVHNENNYTSHDNADDDVHADELLHNDDIASKEKSRSSDDTNCILERKREHRAATKMAALARQRRSNSNSNNHLSAMSSPSTLTVALLLLPTLSTYSYYHSVITFLLSFSIHHNNRPPDGHYCW
jgi:hypothetical protein